MSGKVLRTNNILSERYSCTENGYMTLRAQNQRGKMFV